MNVGFCLQPGDELELVSIAEENRSIEMEWTVSSRSNSKWHRQHAYTRLISTKTWAMPYKFASPARILYYIGSNYTGTSICGIGKGLLVTTWLYYGELRNKQVYAKG